MYGYFIDRLFKTWFLTHELAAFHHISKESLFVLGGLGGGGDSHINRTGVLVREFKRTSKRYKDTAFWAWLESLYIPKS